MQLDFNSVFTKISLAGLLLVSIADFVYAGNLPINHSVGISNFKYIQTGSIFRQAKLENKYIKSNDDSFILRQLYNDMTFLIEEPDFYGVVGGIAMAPSVFGPAFRNESPKFTRLWGPSVFADNFFEAGEIFGNGTLPVAASVASWSIGKVTGSRRLRKFGSDLFRVQAINGFLTSVLKAGINRTRPNGGSYSYPSGHTSTAFAVAGTVYADFGKTWGIPAFALAGYVGLSRLQEGMHYVSDVIAGGILGSYISLKLARREKSQNNVSIAPLINNGAIGLSYRIDF